MPNPPTLAETALSGGLQQRIAEAHTPFGELTIARNVRQNKSGMIEKRPGHAPVGSVAGAVRLGAFQDKLYAFGPPSGTNENTTWGLSAAGFAASHACGEATILQDSVDVLSTKSPLTGASNIGCSIQAPSVAYGNGVIAYVQVVQDDTGTFPGTSAVYYSVVDAASGNVIAGRSVVTASHAPAIEAKVAFAGTTLVIVLKKKGAGNIDACAIASPYTGAPSAFTSLGTDATTSDTGNQLLDVISNGANFTVAYVRASASTYTLASFSAALASVTSRTISCTATVTDIGTHISNGVLLVTLMSASVTQYGWYVPATLLDGGGGLVTYTSLAGFTNKTFRGALNSATKATFVLSGLNGSIPALAAGIVTLGSATGNTGRAVDFNFPASNPFVQNGEVYSFVLANPPTDNAGGHTNPPEATLVLMSWRYSTLVAGTIYSPRPVASDMPRYAGFGAAWLSATGGGDVTGKYPMSVVSAATGKYSIAQNYFHDVLNLFYAQETADFTHPGRWHFVEEQGQLFGSSGPVICDGDNQREIGFLNFCSSPVIADSATSGALLAGQNYDWAVVYGYVDGSGNITRGIPSALVNHTLAASPAKTSVTVTIPIPDPVGVMCKAPGDPVGYFVEIYRSIQSPAAPVQAYLLDRVRITSGGTLNYNDIQGDGAITSNPTLYSFTGAELNAAPPCFVDIVAHKTRLHGIAPDRRTIYYSKAATDGEGMNFADAFTYEVDDVGRLSALVSMDDKLLIFSDRRIYYMIGEGPADNGTQNDYGLPQPINVDAGCIDPRSVVRVPDGVMFQSRIGIYHIDRGLNVTYMGQPVSDELTTYPMVVGSALHPTQPWVYFYVTKADASAGERLVYDYRVGKWYVDKLPGVPVSCASTTSTHYWIDTGGQVWREVVPSDSDQYLDDGNWVTMDVELAPQHAAGVDGWQNLARLQVLFYNATPHDLTIQTRSGYATSYDSPSDTFASTRIAAMQNFNLGTGVSAVEITPASSKVNGISVRITDAAPSGGEAVGTGRGPQIFAVAFETEDLKALANVDDSQRGTGS